MDKTKSLAELIAKVEAGVRPAQDGSLYKLFGDAWLHVYDIHHNGSLDAAKALHEAVLPGRRWNIRHNETGSVATTHNVDPFGHTEEESNTPARAWLLAILRALHDQAETTQ